MRPIILLCLLGSIACDDAGTSEPVNPEPEAPEAGDTYVAGLEKAGADGVLKTRLVDALPAPPELGDNRWMIAVVDQDGAPLEGCTVTLEPRMPAHGHGTNTPAVVTEMGAGQYEVTPVDLFMPGLWVTRVDLECGALRDSVVYEFWIEG